MYAIVDIKGKQFRVEKDQTLSVPKIDGKVGSKIEFDKVLFSSDKGKIETKTSVKVVAEVLSHERENKVVVFKFKRRKGHQKKNGHKQQYTKIKIKDLKAATKKAVAKKAVAKKTEKDKD